VEQEHGSRVEQEPRSAVQRMAGVTLTIDSQIDSQIDGKIDGKIDEKRDEFPSPEMDMPIHCQLDLTQTTPSPDQSLSTDPEGLSVGRSPSVPKGIERERTPTNEAESVWTILKYCLLRISLE